ncbi:MAG: succinyldiaminopimelate transaminase, partial [Pseudomonadota bacterium]
GGDDIAFTQRLFEQAHVSVLPGSLMGRPGANGVNPGAGRLRLALVAELAPTLEAAQRIRRLIESG